ncbi:hypothetical protein CANARDRAFT_203433 [[Candida] arabinofermentans NRRL YB-2248]|uniref:Major facilitator superfamily (MFS) profile domain-containing protein n=1 Tax=[Candida] arabinofermentans NRRL YB-2248 TaxID=983967 RepID=A0A1E4SV49_9ASCO|nr:hypothetical protein CANARDRAFT_203433 [[Candida] arabinofermentans NRRL YB-2248]
MDSTNLYNPVRSTAYIIILTMIVGALQLAWSVEFSEATPFLLSLGISKHVLALIWLAGPLSGTLGQPIVGLLSDKCDMTIGRRRPFVIGGCLATVASLLYLSHSATIVGWFVPGNDITLINKWTVPFASIGIYVLDFSIAVIQASCRALIVDVVPTDQQQIANAWAARMIGIFNILGFWIGTLNLKSLLPFLGDTQFKVLSILVSTIMIVLVSFCCYVIKERNPRTDVTIRIDEKETNIFIIIRSFFKQVISSVTRLPRQVKVVCYAQFFAWIGYFPMLFYTSTYVGELYLYELGYNNPQILPPDQRQELLDEGTRRGTLALLVHAIVTLVVDLALPFLVDNFKSNKYINVRTMWIYSHIVFIIATLSTFFISTSTQAIVLFGFLGIPWGCAVWIPFVLISEEISRIKDIKAEQIYEKQKKQMERLNEHDSQEFGDDSEKYDSGILLAIHNVFVSAPQMLSSLGSSVLFALFKTSDPDEYDDSLGWIFRIGGIVCIGALILSTRVKSKQDLLEEDEHELSDFS